MKIPNLYTITVLLLAAGLSTSCEKFLDRTPLAQIAQDEYFNSDANARSAVMGMYRTMTSSFSYGQSTIIVPEFSANHVLHASSFPEYEGFAAHGTAGSGLNGANPWVANIWQQMYASINAANNIIDHVPLMDESMINEENRSLYLGEAKFVRAYLYFFMVRAFGKVPLKVTSTTEGEELDIPQSEVEEIYAQIVQDLTEAIAHFPEVNPNTGDAAKGRGSYWAAKALLSKVSLYVGDYEQAASLSRETITSGGYSLVEDYQSVWQNQNSGESIFELQFDEQVSNPLAAVSNDNSSMLFYVNADRVLPIFEEDDIRKDVAVKPGSGDRYYMGKFPNFAPAAQNVTLIRLSEIYLIHAEAQARVDNGVSGSSYQSLKAVQDRAGITKPMATYTNLADYIVAIQEEKERELLFEGETWFDFCRTGLASEKFSTIQNENFYLYPIPTTQVSMGNGLDQNPGYAGGE